MIRHAFGNADPYKLFAPMKKDMQGWASHSGIFESAISFYIPSLIVEVGTWKGASAIHMAGICKSLGLSTEIVCVDTFLGSHEHYTEGWLSGRIRNGRPDIYEQFLSNVIHEGMTEYVTPLPMDSVNACHLLRHLKAEPDIIYIDAGHDYESVSQDLRLYSELLRPKGMLIGDDWFHPPVRRAVADTLGKVETYSNDKFYWIKP